MAPSDPILSKEAPPTRRVPLEDLPQLAEIKDPPQEAYLWGALPPRPWVAIVGTRQPSLRGRWNAFHLARRLAQSGVTVVSGGAEGIDSAAHLGALAGGGPTLIVAPVWWERAYPHTNRPLFNAVLKAGGGYLSIAPPEAIPLKFVFFRRNEALAALSALMVLGECPVKSGARNAMLHARRLGRQRFVQAFSYGQVRAQGSFQEWSRGDCELLYQPGAVIQALNAAGPFENERWAQVQEQRARAAEDHQAARVPRPRQQKRAKSPAQMEFSTPTLPEDPAARAVACALLAGAGTVEQICEQSQLSPAEAQHQILLLTLGGLVAEDGRGLLRYHGAGHERR